MSTTAELTQLFPEPHAVPEAHRIVMPVDQTEYLIDGELREWAGGMETVVSPIMWRDGGTLRSVVLGHYPSLGETESLAALQAASHAFDSGRGRWPTSSVAERIECLERFTHAMRDVRAETVRLLMWEIAKSYDDARPRSSIARSTTSGTPSTP